MAMRVHLLRVGFERVIGSAEVKYSETPEYSKIYDL